ncbi:hypothetical protein AB1K91_00950 [Terribacillus sp. 179-K 1B1 HS]|uniref:hypothetical protein n=1 Tax=Terribacillus sp. 179-K 1B1 HS TaxID=3142388 RepID=UPI0039A169F5
MNVILLFGPHDVGKMTAGQELEKQSGYRLLYMPMDLLVPFFRKQMRRLSTRFRNELFRSVVTTDGGIKEAKCIEIKTDDLSASEAAERIIQRFGWEGER